MNLSSSAIRKVTCYTATPVQSCDRCATGIKYVFLVTYKDGETQKYGSECINKILNGKTNLLSLFKKNAKLLKRYKDYVNILSGPVEQMPYGSEYFNSGLYFIADSEGKDISFKHWFFHPKMNTEKNASGGRYLEEPNKYMAKCLKDIDVDVSKLNVEIVRIEEFLAKILRAAPQVV